MIEGTDVFPRSCYDFSKVTMQRDKNRTKVEETKRTARLLEILQMISTAPKRYLRSDLANHFELSERMIQKDLDIIRHKLKLDLIHSPQGYYFEKVPHLPTLQYSFQEALALLLSVQAARQVSGIASGDFAAAVARLEALFPPEFSPILRNLVATSQPSVEGSRRQEMLSLLNYALVFKRKVDITYKTRSRGGDLNQRVIHPYSLLPYVRSWQLIAYCEWRQKVLLFKIDRIQEARLLNDTYTMPKDFSIEEYLGQNWGLMRGEQRKPEEILLHFGPEAGSWVSEEYWHHSQRVETLPDGCIHFHLTLAVTPEFINWLLYYGDRLTVLSPAWLREEVRNAHFRAYKKYHHIDEEV